MDERIVIRMGDITEMDVDAIVNAANERLAGGGGVDGAIHRVAGPELARECREIGRCATGSAVITLGYDLPCDYVIHTVGPIWMGGGEGEAELLASCYESSLRVAGAQQLKTIAFSAISTGVYGFPLDKACAIALKSVDEHLKENRQLTEVVMVCFGRGVFESYSSAAASL